MIAAVLAVSATSGIEENASAENDKWVNHYPVKDFTYDFPVSPNFAVDASGGDAGGNLTVRGTGTLSSPDLSPPHTGTLLVSRNINGGWWEQAAPMCLQMAMAHAAMPAGSPRHFVMHFTAQNPVYADLLVDTRGFPNVYGANTVTCSER
jgi:hypothetical protein